MRYMLLVSAGLCGVLAPTVDASFITCKNDKQGWIDAVNGNYTTLDFNFGQTAAHNINDWNWVIGTALIEVSEVFETHAVLLVQAGDINLDGTVDGADLGLLNARWGLSGTSGHLFLENVNATGVVDGSDQGILLANWGNSREVITVSLACEYCDSESLMSGPTQAMSVEEALDSLGFADHEAFVSWAAESSEAQIIAMGYSMAALVFSGQ